MQVVSQHVQDEEVVLPFFKPYSRAEKLLRRTNVPIPAQVASVNPNIALLIIFDVDKSISNSFKGKISPRKRRKVPFTQISPCQNVLIDIDFVDIPLKFSVLAIAERHQSFSVSFHLMVKIDMAHSFDQNEQFASSVAASHIEAVLQRSSSIKAANETSIKVGNCEIMHHHF